jgi:hypothetical protein
LDRGRQKRRTADKTAADIPAHNAVADSSCTTSYQPLNTEDRPVTTIRDYTPKPPDPQGDDQTQPSKSPGEIEGDEGRGVTSPSQPGRRDRQDPNEYPGGSDDDQAQGDEENWPPPDPQRSL